MSRFFRNLNRRMQLRYRFEYAVAVILIYTVRAMSPSMAWRAARRLGRFTFRVGLRRGTIMSNLRIAFPDESEQWRRQVGFRTWEHFLSLAVDIILQRRMLHRSNVLEKITISGWGGDFIREHGVEALSKEVHGCVFCGGHFGNWELATGMFKLLGVRIVPIFRAPSNPFIADLVRRVRLDSQTRLLERRGAVRGMIDTLEAGGNVGFLFDQEAASGMPIPLFGVEAPTHKTPAVLFRDVGAPLFFGSMIRRGDFFDYEARGALLTDPPKTDDRYEDVKQIMTDLNRRLEERIRENPEQYFWLHRRWKKLGIHAPRPKKEKMS